MKTEPVLGVSGGEGDHPSTDILYERIEGIFLGLWKSRKPVFAQRNLSVLGTRIFGKNRNVVKMRVEDEQGFSMDAVYFGEASAFCRRVSEGGKMDLVYYPSVNTYQGRENLQLIISDKRLVTICEKMVY